MERPLNCQDSGTDITNKNVIYDHTIVIDFFMGCTVQSINSFEVSFVNNGYNRYILYINKN